MAFRRSPVRSRSGPPAFARPSGALRLASPVQCQPGERNHRRRLSAEARSAKADWQATGSLPSEAPRSNGELRFAVRRIGLPRAMVGYAYPASLVATLRNFLQSWTTRLSAAIADLRDMSSSPKRFVYLLRSLGDPGRPYVGATSNVAARLAFHNAGGSPHTAKHRPWKLNVSIEFSDEQRALAFEKYLKSGSGRAFARRHFEQ
jgi:putative endonuclease